tara:strand:- start:27 stop:212 length:186 start_codon:yes stop_codon:yes gene_type:complete
MSYNNQPDLEEWCIEQFKNCEDGKLTTEQKTQFLDFIDENKHSKFIQSAFKKHLERNKNLN